MTGWPEGVGRRVLEEVDSTNAEAARIAEAPAKGPTLKAPNALGAWLRSTLGGRRLTALTASPDDRIFYRRESARRGNPNARAALHTLP